MRVVHTAELRRTPYTRSSMLLSVALAAGLPGGRLCRVQRPRQARRQPQKPGFVHHLVLQQQAPARPDAPGRLPELDHQLL